MRSSASHTRVYSQSRCNGSRKQLDKSGCRLYLDYLQSLGALNSLDLPQSGAGPECLPGVSIGTMAHRLHAIIACFVIQVMSLCLSFSQSVFICTCLKQHKTFKAVHTLRGHTRDHEKARPRAYTPYMNGQMDLGTTLDTIYSLPLFSTLSHNI